MQDTKTKRRWRPSGAMAVAMLALFASLSGTAVAAKVMITNPNQLGDAVVTSRSVGDGQVQSADLSQPVVAAGINKGLRGDDEPFLINPTTDVVGVSKPGGPNSGSFTVTFAEPVRHCQWTATPANILGEESGIGVMIEVRPSQFDAHDVFVFTQRLETVGSLKGQILQEPHSFYLMGRC
jgi:hypothetical protein